MKHPLLNFCQRMLERVESGEMTESEAVAAMRVSYSKDRAKAMKQSENSHLPNQVRMGCSKKGYTRQHSSCTSGSQI